MQDMVVRGAPAIGVTGALALAVHLISGGRGAQYSSVQACLDDIRDTMDYLVTRWGGPGGWGGGACQAAHACLVLCQHDWSCQHWGIRHRGYGWPS